MSIPFKTPAGPITSQDDWAATTGARDWKDGRAARELARAWWRPNQGPGVPAELGELLPPSMVVEQVQVRDGAHLLITARDDSGTIALHVHGIADETFGDPIEAVMVDSARRLARDEPSEMVSRIARLATSILPVRSEGTPSLGELRFGLLTDVAETMAFAADLGTLRALYVVHEIVHLQKTKESARRRNREDLDLFIRRLTGGEAERLHRGVLLGPIELPGYPGLLLQVGKVRRDLDVVVG